MKHSFFNRWEVKVVLSLILPLVCVFAFLICQGGDVCGITGISSSSTGQEIHPNASIIPKSSARYSESTGGENRMKDSTTQLPAKEGTGLSVPAESSDLVVESSEEVLDTAPPFLYEIKSTKLALLDSDQQLAVQKTFESYLAFQQAGGGNADFRYLKESSERLKEQLAAEIGPMSVHDLMQGE